MCRTVIVCLQSPAVPHTLEEEQYYCKALSDEMIKINVSAQCNIIQVLFVLHSGVCL